MKIFNNLKQAANILKITDCFYFMDQFIETKLSSKDEIIKKDG